MAIIATLAVSVQARTKKFKRKIKDIRKSVNRFAGSILKMNFVFNKFGAILGAITIGAMAAFIIRTAKTVDLTAKFAERIGIAVEALTELQFANTLAGNTTTLLNLGLQRMTRRISEAAQGLGEAKGALIELGIEADAINKLSPDKQFKAIADAMENVATQGDRVRLAMRLFDTEAVALLLTMKGGSVALNRAAKEAAKFGFVLDRIDVEKIVAANQAFDRLKLLIVGIGRRITTELAPFIEFLIKRITDFGTEGKGAGSTVVDALELVTKAIAKTTEFVQSLIAVFQRLGGVILKQVSILRGGPFLKTGRLLIKEADRLLNEADAAFARIASGKTLQNVTDLFKDIRESAEKAAEAIVNSGKGLKGVGKIISKSPLAQGRKITFGREIDLARTAITGLRGRREQQVSVKQLDTTNMLLSEIRNKIGGGTLAVAG